MNVAARAVLARYLRQLQDLGEKDLYLDELSARDVMALVRGTVRTPPRTVVSPSAPPAPPASTSARQLHPELAVLRDEVMLCNACALHSTRNTVVFERGSPTARLAVVGEAPGAEEDRQGQPFVGPAGKLLDLMLQSIGFGRDDVYICNVLKCRPPGNRDPLPDEVAKCTLHLQKQLEFVAPQAILAVGKFAGQMMSGKELPIGRLRGQIHGFRGIPVIATFHPAFLLRSPQWIRSAWQDLQQLRQVLDEQV
jgi:uracil-DNA glycosylase